MKCTTCPELGQRIDYTTFVCNYTGGFLSLEDLSDPEAICPKDTAASGSVAGFKMRPQKRATKKLAEFTCGICQEKFESRAILLVHRKEAHLTCKYCGRILKTPQARKKHEMHCKKRGEAVAS